MGEEGYWFLGVPNVGPGHSRRIDKGTAHVRRLPEEGELLTSSDFCFTFVYLSVPVSRFSFLTGGGISLLLGRRHM